MAEAEPVKFTVAEVLVTLADVRAVAALQVAVVVNVTVAGLELTPPAQLLTMDTVYATPGLRPVKLTEVAEPASVWVVVAGLVVTV